VGIGSTSSQRDVVRIVRDAVNSAIGHAIGQGQRVGVACSGGVDSMALADAALSHAPVIVTIDHQLSPASATVAAGVAAWASQQGMVAIVSTVDVDRTASIEAAARVARYAAFETVIATHALDVLLLAHTQRDQAETVLMRIIRGTGPAGLVGIPRRRAAFVRPLIDLPRDITEAYVNARNLPIWDDPMNADPRITRVRVRDTVLPTLRRENPAIDDALVRLSNSAAEWLEVIDRLAAPFAFPIDCAALASQPAAVRKRALALALDRANLDFDASHLESLDELVCAPDRGEVSLDVPGARIVRSYAKLDFAVSRFAAPNVYNDDVYEVRLWQPGDRMCPARLAGHSRKLSDLFIDLKIPRDHRATARVMVRRTDQKIVWADHIGTAFGESLDLLPR
jgi:tRNA(Ile)-lysidine synthase